MARFKQHSRRRGSLIPLLAISSVSLFAFVALAVDLGMLAVSRTQCQGGADAAALAGCRTLNNKPNVPYSNLPAAVEMARQTVYNNFHLSANFVEDQIQNIQAGQYLYNTQSQLFRVSSWTDVKDSQTMTPTGGGSWTGIRVTMQVTQPTYFMKVLGVTSMPMNATASAVYRPRDIAFVLDMTGSMAYASQFNFSYNGGKRSLNPDNLIPSFGHYVSMEQYLRATDNQANTDGEAFSMNNFTVATAGGPPLARHFYFDPANIANPATPVLTVTTNGNEVMLKNAFHRWSPSESGGDSTSATPPTYDFTGYNAMSTGAEATPMGPTPAPDTFGTMTDSPGIPYVGDRWRRADGTIKKTEPSWATGAVTTKAATTAIDLLGYNLNGNNVRGGAAPQTAGSTTITTVDRFRDPVWEQYGYDLDISKYRIWKGTAAPGTAANYVSANGAGVENNIKVPVADRFQGYSMGPGYWGKTFYIWPPDPRTPDMAQASGGDWRRRFFKRTTTTAFNPQNDAMSNGDANDGINEALLSGGNLTVTTTTGNYVIDYAAVLKWIKSGPQVLPPNLRAGRVLYYSSIPDNVDISGNADSAVNLDKLFWREYIDYVVGRDNNFDSYLYGYADSWASSATNIYTGNMETWNGPSNNWTPTNQRPYMRYNDSPNRPRLHLWFGPLSMMDFLGGTQRSGTGVRSWNWRPGTCPEAQCWQLKAGMRAVLDDVRNNHPNDYAGLVMFAAQSYNDIRRPIGQNYNSLKNALFYPKSLLNAIDAGDLTTEVRPYTSSFSNASPADNIPNANGSTDPNTGLAYGFNLLSPSSLLPNNYPDGTTPHYGTYRGRRGASKVVIFETDGVPNTYRGQTNSVRTMSPTLRGYNTFYPDSEWCSNQQNNGDDVSKQEAVKVVQQIVKMAATTPNMGADSGLSLPNAPARVYPIAFGDLFDTETAPNAKFRPKALEFLGNIAAAGNTGSLPATQIITGPYEQRIDRLKDCMQRIFQSGVAVVLIE